MSTPLAPPRSLPFELGEPRSFHGLTTIPLFPAAPSALDYVGLHAAAHRPPPRACRGGCEARPPRALRRARPLGLPHTRVRTRAARRLPGAAQGAALRSGGGLAGGRGQVGAFLLAL